MFYDPSLDLDIPPVPSLASINPNEVCAVQDVAREAWGEGTDTKWKAYQQLRAERKKYYAEQKEMKLHKKRKALLGKAAGEVPVQSIGDTAWSKDGDIPTEVLMRIKQEVVDAVPVNGLSALSKKAVYENFHHQK